MEFDVIDLIYAALPMREQKHDIFMQRRLGQIFTCLLKWGQGSCNKYGTRTGVAKLMFDQLNCDHLRDGHSPRDSDHPRIVWLQSLEW